MLNSDSYLYPDPHYIKILDLDPHYIKILDLDPHTKLVDPKHCMHGLQCLKDMQGLLLLNF